LARRTRTSRVSVLFREPTNRAPKARPERERSEARDSKR
jgi:hypothetical protein